MGRVEPQLGKTTTVCPTAAGAKSWNSMAYSPRTGYLYVPVNELCEDITPNNSRARGRAELHERDISRETRLRDAPHTAMWTPGIR